ncbi:hypothetical protein GCM10009030_22810 [Haloarcula pellucida]|uniref:Uncharacterized protein n=1 Tax=Haloarcula pellucida TaxID=1427151 RepID=A0A830GMA6_9EURY|nr:hypothetical protein GCM10009030_22810 [Halomicroarcula pellucida]
MVSDWLCLFQYGLVIWVRFRILVNVSAVLSFWLSWNSNTRILGVDEDRSRCCLDRVPEISSEAVMPTAPQG